MFGCKNNSNPAAPVDQRNVIFTEGFEGGQAELDTIWTRYLITIEEGFYTKMRLTTDTAHTGTHSITSDSNRTALEYDVFSRIESGIVGVEFFILAKSAGQTNFTISIGQNAGSTGGLGKEFGLGFDQTDSVKCVFFDDRGVGENDAMISPIQLNHWYKCNVEVDFTSQKITYYLDNAKVRTLPFPTQEMYGIDRLLVFRGFGLNGEGAEGPKSYFADDITLYTK